MEVLWFLKRRTAFIRRYYETAAAPFLEIIRKIDAEEEPYVPPYSEDEEPPFVAEWMEANTALEILGATCVSMLSEALKLYFMTWERELGIECQKRFPGAFDRKKGNGFVNGYRECFGHLLKTDWSDCPVDFALIEQIAMARNDAQHPKQITDLQLTHNEKIREKHPLPFFLNEHEEQLIETGQGLDYPWFAPTLVVTKKKLLEAIRQVELLGKWMEEPLFDVKYGRR